MRLKSLIGIGGLLTLLGLLGVIWLGAAGVTLATGLPTTGYDWEEPEGRIGVAVAIATFVAWILGLGLLTWKYVRTSPADYSLQRRQVSRWLLAALVPVVSIALVVFIAYWLLGHQPTYV